MRNTARRNNDHSHQKSSTLLPLQPANVLRHQVLSERLRYPGGTMSKLGLRPEAVENSAGVLLWMLVNPQREGASPPLLSQISHSGDIEHVRTSVAANGLQPLQHFFRDPHRFALTHPRTTCA